jgi:hypothetical protein
MTSQDDFQAEDIEAKVGLEPQTLTPQAHSPYSQEQIKEMKAMGLPKPEDCPWAEWSFGVDSLSPRHELLIIYAAHGKRPVEIASLTEFTPAYVRALLKTPKVANEVRRVQTKLFAGEYRKRIEAMANPALDVLSQVMSNETEKASVRVQVAQYLIDQGIGKAKQDFKVEGTLLADFMSELKSKSRAVEDIQLKLAKPKDALDTFVEEFIPESFTVGDKRDEKPEPKQGVYSGASEGSEDGSGQTEDWFQLLEAGREASGDRER